FSVFVPVFLAVVFFGAVTGLGSPLSTTSVGYSPLRRNAARRRSSGKGSSGGTPSHSAAAPSGTTATSPGPITYRSPLNRSSKGSVPVLRSRVATASSSLARLRQFFPVRLGRAARVHIHLAVFRVDEDRTGTRHPRKRSGRRRVVVSSNDNARAHVEHDLRIHGLDNLLRSTRQQIRHVKHPFRNSLRATLRPPAVTSHSAGSRSHRTPWRRQLLLVKFPYHRICITAASWLTGFFQPVSLKFA